MLDAVQIILISVVVGVVGLLIVYRIIRFIRERRKRSLSIHKAAFAISGNLVQEHGATQKITDNYRLTKILLGRGSSAEVFVGENVSNNHRYAIKVIDLSRKDIIWRYEREKNFLKDIEHSNAIRLFEVYNSPKQMFFVMELCTGGHLGHLLKRQENAYKNLPELRARSFIVQIARAIRHCHEHGICHRDIKLQNILLENNSPDAQIKIVDFGNAVRFFGCTPLRKVVGTTYTAAPEVFRQSYDERCDVWSLGVVAYILLSGKRPFGRVETEKHPPATSNSGPPVNAPNPNPIPQSNATSILIESILSGKYHFHHEAFQHVSHEAIDFIITCLTLDYTKRAYAKDLVDHPWLRNEFLLHKNSTTFNHTTLAESDDSERNIDPTAFFSYPTITQHHIQTILDSSRRRLSHVTKTGMRDASMLAVAFTMPVNKIKQIRNLFQEIDQNGNGVIEKDEFLAVMLSIQTELTMKNIENLFDSIDQNGDGSISFLEFVAAMIDPREVDIQHMQEAFRLLDKDHKGYLIKQDLLRVLCTDSMEVNEQQQQHHRDIHEPTNQTSPNNNHNKSPLSRMQSQSSRKFSTSSVNSHASVGLLEIELQKEQERHQLIREKVDRLFNEADLNGDGRLNYSEFLFAMAEGSMKFQDFIHNNNDHSGGSNTSGLLGGTGNPLQIKSTSALPSLSTSYSFRRQSESNTKIIVSPNRFKLPPLFGRGMSQNFAVASSSDGGGLWNYLAATLSPTRKNSQTVQPDLLTPLAHRNSSNNHLYVDNVGDLNGENLEPVDYLDDSPIPDGDDIEGTTPNKSRRTSTTPRTRSSPRKLTGTPIGDTDIQYRQLLTKDEDGEDSSRKKSGSIKVPPMLSPSHRSLTSPALLNSVSSEDKHSNFSPPIIPTAPNRRPSIEIPSPAKDYGPITETPRSISSFVKKTIKPHHLEDDFPDSPIAMMKVDDEDDENEKDFIENRQQLDDYLSANKVLSTDAELEYIRRSISLYNNNNNHENENEKNENSNSITRGRTESTSSRVLAESFVSNIFHFHLLPDNHSHNNHSNNPRAVIPMSYDSPSKLTDTEAELEV